MTTTGQDRTPVSTTTDDLRVVHLGFHPPLDRPDSGAARRWSGLVGLMLTVALVSACGTTPAAQETDQAQATTSGTAATTVNSEGVTVSRSSAPTAGDPSSTPTSSATDPGLPTSVTSNLSGLPSGAAVSLTGTVTEGVERGCVVLVDDNDDVLANLLGFDQQAHPFGSRISVTGRWATARMSFCQQGPLLEVDSVSAAG